MYSVEWEQWNIKTIHSEYWHLNWMYWLNAQPSIFISVIRSQNDYSHVVQLLFMRLDMNANAVLRERPNAYFEWISHPNAKLENRELIHLPKYSDSIGILHIHFVLRMNEWQTEHLHGHLTFHDYNVHITCRCPNIWKQMPPKTICDTNVEKDQSHKYWAIFEWISDSRRSVRARVFVWMPSDKSL